MARDLHTAVRCAALRRLSDAAAELKRMYFGPEARGFGIAGRLLSEIDVHARRMGVRTLQLETGVRQLETLGFYRSAGFELRGHSDYRPDPLSIFMEKKLA